MDGIEKTTSSRVEAATSSAHQAIEQISDAARPAVSRAASGAHRWVDRIAGTTTRVAKQLQDTGTRLKGAEERLVTASSGYVREHPLRSLGLALAAGLLVSHLTTSYKSTERPRKSGEGGGLVV